LEALSTSAGWNNLPIETAHRLSVGYEISRKTSLTCSHQISVWQWNFLAKHLT
jgi:hypothetical protein